MNKQKTQIRIKTIDKTILKLYIIFLKKTLKLLNIDFSIFCLPKKKKKISLLKSPHVNKKAIEQFELQLFSSILILENNCNSKILKYLIINKPKSIDLKLKRMV